MKNFANSILQLILKLLKFNERIISKIFLSVARAAVKFYNHPVGNKITWLFVRFVLWVVGCVLGFISVVRLVVVYFGLTFCKLVEIFIFSKSFAYFRKFCKIIYNFYPINKTLKFIGRFIKSIAVKCVKNPVLKVVNFFKKTTKSKILQKITTYIKFIAYLKPVLPLTDLLLFLTKPIREFDTFIIVLRWTCKTIHRISFIIYYALKPYRYQLLLCYIVCVVATFYNFHWAIGVTLCYIGAEAVFLYNLRYNRGNMPLLYCYIAFLISIYIYILLVNQFIIVSDLIH